MHQGFKESAEQFFEVARFQLDSKKLVERLGLGLAHLIIGVVECENHAKVQLLAHPLKIRMLIGDQRFEHWAEQLIVFLQGLQDRAGRQVELSEPAAVVLHLFDEMQWGFALSKNAGGGSGRDLRESRTLLRLESQAAQAA